MIFAGCATGGRQRTLSTEISALSAGASATLYVLKRWAFASEDVTHVADEAGQGGQEILNAAIAVKPELDFAVKRRSD